jgi:hypothetical protein
VAQSSWRGDGCFRLFRKLTLVWSLALGTSRMEEWLLYHVSKLGTDLSSDQCRTPLLTRLFSWSPRIIIVAAQQHAVITMVASHHIWANNAYKPFVKIQATSPHLRSSPCYFNVQSPLHSREIITTFPVLLSARMAVVVMHLFRNSWQVNNNAGSRCVNKLPLHFPLWMMLFARTLGYKFPAWGEANETTSTHHHVFCTMASI